MKSDKLPEKILIIRPNITVQSAETHISLGLMNGFLEHNLNCKIIGNIQDINYANQRTLVIDDFCNYKSEIDLKHSKWIAKKGTIIDLWVNWPICKDSQFYQFHKKIILKNLDLFKIIYGRGNLIQWLILKKLQIENIIQFLMLHPLPNKIF